MVPAIKLRLLTVSFALASLSHGFETTSLRPCKKFHHSVRYSSERDNVDANPPPLERIVTKIGADPNKSINFS